MENTPLEPAESDTTEPTPLAHDPSRQKPSFETWQQQNPELMFLLGIGVGLLSILFAAAITFPTNGQVPGCVLPALGLFISPLLMASKPNRFLAFGLLLSFLIATPLVLPCGSISSEGIEAIVAKLKKNGTEIF